MYHCTTIIIPRFPRGKRKSIRGCQASYQQISPWLEILGKRKRTTREFRLTCSGDVSWWPESRGKEGDGGLLHGWRIEAHFYLRWGCIMVAGILWGKKAMVVCSMAGGQKLTVNQITDDLGHERAWNLGEKKENGEGVPFYLLFVSGMHHGGRNLLTEKAPVVCTK